MSRKHGAPVCCVCHLLKTISKLYTPYKVLFLFFPCIGWLPVAPAYMKARRLPRSILFSFLYCHIDLFFWADKRSWSNIRSLEIF